MKIILYCQHIWGVGHYFRSLEICKALIGHDILMVTGGAEVDTPLPVALLLAEGPPGLYRGWLAQQQVEGARQGALPDHAGLDQQGSGAAHRRRSAPTSRC